MDLDLRGPQFLVRVMEILFHPLGSEIIVLLSYWKATPNVQNNNVFKRGYFTNIRQ